MAGLVTLTKSPFTKGTPSSGHVAVCITYSSHPLQPWGWGNAPHVIGEETEAQGVALTQLLSGRAGFKERSDSTAHLLSTLSLYPIMRATWAVWAFVWSV